MREFSLYINRETPISRLDPRTKVVATACLFVLAMAFNHPLYLVCVLGFEAWLVFVSRSLVNLKRLNVLLVLLFVFSIVMWSLFLQEGPLILKMGPLSLWRDSSLYALGMGMRLVALVVAGLVFLSSTMVEEFVFALRKFGLPLPVAFAFSLAFRMVSQVFRTAGTVKQAQQIRGLDLDSGGIFKRIKNHVPILIPILVYSIRSVESLTVALEARGFRCTRRQTAFIIPKLRACDYVVIVVSATAAVTAIVLRTKGFGEVLPRL